MRALRIPSFSDWAEENGEDRLFEQQRDEPCRGQADVRHRQTAHSLAVPTRTHPHDVGFEIAIVAERFANTTVREAPAFADLPLLRCPQVRK
jgi:hypothetical protein